MKTTTHISPGPRVGGELSSNQRDFTCRYSLRENPKKTQKSPTPGLNPPKKSLLRQSGIKKNLIRCKECGKGFRYEKCLSKHHIGRHFGNKKSAEESSGTSSSSFSLVRKKRSRLIRYKKTQVSSFSTFLVSSFSVSEIEQEVAESLILLSRSNEKYLEVLKLVDEVLDSNIEILDVNPRKTLDYHDYQLSLCSLSNKKVRKAGEFDQGFLNDEQKLQLREGISIDETLKDPQGSLGDKNTSEASEFDQNYVHDQLKNTALVDEAEMENEIDHEKKSQVGDEAGFEAADSVSRKPACYEAGYEVSGLEIKGCSSFESSGRLRSNEHRCRICDKVFLSYQALGGHQTLHRLRNKSICRGNGAEKGRETVEVEVEGVNGSMEHKCRACSRIFRSVHALGGHKKCHGGAKKSGKPKDNEQIVVVVKEEENMGKRDEIDLNVPATLGVEL